MGKQKTKLNVRRVKHESFIENITWLIETGIEIYIETHGETGTPTGGTVDILRLKKGLKALLSNNLDKIMEEVVSYKRSVSAHFSHPDLLLLRKKRDEVARSSSLSERKKFYFWKLVTSFDVMLSMVVAKTLATVVVDEDEVIAESYYALIGCLMMVVGDINHGQIPSHYIDTLIVCGLKIERVDGAEVEALNIDGLTVEALSQQCERRQAALFGVA